MREDTAIEGRALGPEGRFHLLRLRIHRGRIESVEPLAEPWSGAGEAGSIRISGPEVDSRRLGVSRGGEDGWPHRSGHCEIPGAVLLPGFVDGHTHLLGVGLGGIRPDLSGARSREEALARLEAWLSSNPGRTPVIAEGWDESNWTVPEPIRGADLDRLSAERPVAARRVCGHIAAVNREAVGSLGPDAPGLDAGSGVAVEGVAMTLTRLWPPGESELRTALGEAQRQAFLHGVTGVQEMGDPVSFRAFGLAEAAGELRVRVSHYFHSDSRSAIESAGLVPGQGSERLRVAGIKIFLDGSFGARSAAVREPYPGTGNRGVLTWKESDLCRELEACAARGWPLAVHVIGDAAADQLLSAVETVTGGGIYAQGLRLEHAEMMPPDLFERALRAGARFSMQPNFTSNWQGRGQLYEQVLGIERTKRLNPYRSIAGSGRLHFGSDTMPLGPLHGIEGAIAHPDPEERLSFASALLAYGSGAAVAVSRPFHRAELRPGEPADLTVLSGLPGDPGSVRTTGGLAVAATWVGGELVHWSRAGGADA